MITIADPALAHREMMIGAVMGLPFIKALRWMGRAAICLHYREENHTMRHPAMIAFLSIICLEATDAQAQGENLLLQSAVNAAGKTCAAVTAINPVGATTSGSAVIAVACSGGERYALEAKDEGALSIKFISDCATFEHVVGRKCF